MVKHNVTVEDSSPLVSSHRTNASTTAEFSFNGTGVYVFGTKGPTGSTYNITLSAASPNLTAPPGTSGPATFVGTSKAPTTVYQQLLFASTALDASTPHHLQIGNYGFGEFILDFIIVESEVNGTSAAVKGNATMEGQSVRKMKVDDSSSAFEYQGSGWTSDVSGNMLEDLLSNETQHSTSDSGASVLLRFRGSGVELHGQYSTGAFLAQLDDRSVVPVNTSYQSNGPKALNRPRELLFFADGLQEDNHQLLVTNQGGSDSGGLSIDFAVVSTTDPDNMTGLSTAADTVRATKSPSHSVPVGAIVGGVVGVLALLVLAVLGIWYLRVYRRRRTNNVRAIDLNDEGDAGFDVEKAALWESRTERLYDAQPSAGAAATQLAECALPLAQRDAHVARRLRRAPAAGAGHARCPKVPPPSLTPPSFFTGATGLAEPIQVGCKVFL
ncbi:hypothetical protein EWM64_g2443 [Hericium alpestre]|uniref:Uncharacterized protein n=1 Tax=Hericium alpestre TaxID=135208 RepID=A0A4Z0A6P3_9AGAM|nr:hypothetical protein EWM64_g2443 [Hericium alpestre]